MCDDFALWQIIEINLMKTVKFLNEFDIAVRGRIATMNEKLTKLERAVDYCEAAIKSSNDRVKAES